MLSRHKLQMELLSDIYRQLVLHNNYLKDLVHVPVDTFILRIMVSYFVDFVVSNLGILENSIMEDDLD